MSQKNVFTTQDGWPNLHPWAMLLNVAALFTLIFTPHAAWAQKVITTWLGWWILGYFPMLALTGGKFWDPFWLYELWDDIQHPTPPEKGSSLN